MALEWVVLSYTAAAEATLLLLTTPLLTPVRRSAAAASRAALKPLAAVVPFSLFLLQDIYWKHESRPMCDHKAQGCNLTELIRYQKSLAKAQRNAVLVASALLMFWLLFAVSGFVVQLEHLQQRLQKLMNQD